MSDDETTLSHFILGAPLDVQRAYARLLTERDRLRATLHKVVARDVDAVAERDRLRAVVDAVREFDDAWAVWRRNVDRGLVPINDEARRRAAAIALIDRVRQLDVSANMGGGDRDG